MNEIRVSKSCIGDQEIKAVVQVLEKGFLGMGSEVQRFEEELSEFFGRTALCCVNGTAALHLALQSIGINRGDEVLVQSLTYLASYQAITACGAKPISCDVLSNAVQVDLADAELKITPKTKAIMPVHYAGGVGDLTSIYEFAKKHNLRVIEDAAHAFGSSYKDAKVGSFGDISCFSFDGIKNITSGEGGCIVTNDEVVIRKIKDARLLGVEKDTEKRFAGERSWDPDVNAQGWRYHMSDIMAAIGRVQLLNFNLLKSKRQLLAKHYNLKLKNLSEITIFDHDFDLVVPHIYVVKLDHGIDRKLLMHFLLNLNIQVGIHYKPNHLLSYFIDKFSANLHVTEKLYPRLLTLPMHPDLEIKDIDFIVKSLREGIESAR